METGTGHFNPTGPLSPIHESDLESNNLQTLGSNPGPTVKSPATNNNEILKLQDSNFKMQDLVFGGDS